MFNISVSSVIKTVKDSATSMNVTQTMEGDSTPGKTNIWKNLINNEHKLQTCILLYVKNGKYEDNQQS